MFSLPICASKRQFRQPMLRTLFLKRRSSAGLVAARTTVVRPELRQICPKIRYRRAGFESKWSQARACTNFASFV